MQSVVRATSSLGVVLLLGFAVGSTEAKPKIVELHKIWDKDPHSAFTDLIWHKNRWICTFRVGKGHVSPDGALQVLASPDGKTWKPIARLTSSKADLRDPKISITPDGNLMMVAAAALHPPAKAKHQSMVWFSKDGSTWDEGTPIGDPNVWLWRVTWHDGIAYGVGYSTVGDRFTRLYKSKDGKTFETLVDKLHTEGYTNETSLAFTPKGECYCLLRRDGKLNTALLGRSSSPYTKWEWKDLGVRAGGPKLLRLPSGRWLAVVRLYKPKVRTALCEVDPKQGTLRELLAFPSGGDTSYAGMVWREDHLWVSYYASHEGKTSIYFAKVQLDE